MTNIERLKAEIDSLPAGDAAEILRWLAEKDWNAWDQEIEADSQARKLNFLIDEALEEKRKGNLKSL